MELEFRKGSIDNMLGDVIGYAELKEPLEIRKAQIIAAFGTYDKRVFLRKTKELNVTSDNVNMSLEQGKLMERFDESAWFSFPLADIKSELDLLKGEEDVIFTGKWSRLESAVYSLLISMDTYRKLASQKLRTGNLRERAPPLTYQDFIGKETELRDYINIKFVNQMIFAKLQGDNDELDSLVSMFLDFSCGSSYSSDTVEICKRARDSGASKPNIMIIDLLVDKIAAINSDKHEKAARIRDELKLLDRQSQK